LVDRLGNVIGVNTILLTNEAGEGSNGVNFAISSNIVAAALSHLLHPGTSFLGWIGAHLQDLTPELRRALDAPSAGVVIVTEVDAQSAASDAGLKPGDVILRFGDETPRNARELMLSIAETKAGTTKNLTIWSTGKVRDVAVTIRAYQGMTHVNLESPLCLPPTDPDLGLLLEPITPIERQLYDLDDNAAGVVVVAVNPMSEAYGLGMRPGIVVEQINGRPVATREEANQILTDAAKRSPVAGLLVQWSKGPSWFTLHTGYEMNHTSVRVSSAQLSAICGSGGSAAQEAVEASGAARAKGRRVSLTSGKPAFRAGAD
jgi:serine protease Do